MAEHKTLPTGTPLIAWSRQLDVKLENGTQFPYDPENPVPDWVMQDQRHACRFSCNPSCWFYPSQNPVRLLPLTKRLLWADYACVSYVDEHVGYILDTLQQTGMADNTLVLFHADVSAPPTLDLPMTRPVLCSRENGPNLTFPL